MGCPGRRFRAAAFLTVLVLVGCASDVKPRDLAAEYHNLGNGFFDLKRYDKAIRYFEMALERNPDLTSTRWNLALAYYHGGDFDNAEKLLAAWIQRDPEALEPREALSLVYRGQGRREEALEVLDGVLVTAPEDTTALNNKSIILWELGRRPEAVQTLEKLLEYEPYSPRALYDLVLLYDEQGMSDRALEEAVAYLAVAESSKEKPADVIVASLIAARAYARNEVYYRALETYTRVVELDEKQPDAWFEQAAILLTSVEDPAHGYQAFQKALDAGFTDLSRIAELLARENLLDRGELEGLLSSRDLLPSAAELENAKRQAVAQRASAVLTPRMPWAESGSRAPPATEPTRTEAEVP